MKRATKPEGKRPMQIELLKDHWTNGRKFGAGTVLSLPESVARNLIDWGAAQEVGKQAKSSKLTKSEKKA